MTEAKHLRRLCRYYCYYYGALCGCVKVPFRWPIINTCHNGFAFAIPNVWKNKNHSDKRFYVFASKLEQLCFRFATAAAAVDASFRILAVRRHM